MDKALKKFSMSFQLEYAIPDWKHRGHTVFPTGILNYAGCVQY